jgi:uncharacterized protein (DUF2147 family)
MKSKFFLTFLFLALGLVAITAQDSPAGVWKTIDDATGEAKSHVEIYEQNGKYYGKVVKLLQREPDTLCENCKGDKKNKPVLGMLIIEDMEAVKDYWKKGSIMDPENGNEYGCSIWFEDGKADELKVRGKHWTGLYRTQTWYRVK